MRKMTIALAIAASSAAAIPAVAQMPGTADAARVKAGRYTVDPNHTQVVWTVDHMGFTPLTGAFGATGGSLELDPAKPAAAKVTVTFDTAAMSTTSAAFAKHLSGSDFFDVAKFPTATFTSTAVQASGQTARITGNLTIKGVTKPVTLDARFFGAGVNPMNKKDNVGFTATTSIKRSDFALGNFVPVVGDKVDLTIHGAFVRGE